MLITKLIKKLCNGNSQITLTFFYISSILYASSFLFPHIEMSHGWYVACCDTIISAHLYWSVLWDCNGIKDKDCLIYLQIPSI